MKLDDWDRVVHLNFSNNANLKITNTENYYPVLLPFYKVQQKDF